MSTQLNLTLLDDFNVSIHKHSTKYVSFLNIQTFSWRSII